MKYNDRTIRHELKYYIDDKSAFLLQTLLKRIIKPDENMKDPNGYLVSSVYFDDIYNSALHDKNSGINFRKKFRIRTYNLDDSLIRLECKEKYGQYISKISARLTREEYNAILAGDYECLRVRKEEVCKLLYIYSKTRLIHPVVVVEYLREAYTMDAGNVRITFDKEISSSIGCLDVYSEYYITKRVIEDGYMVLEVKYDDYLPKQIFKILGSIKAQRSAISKYVMCRDEKRKVGYR